MKGKKWTSKDLLERMGHDLLHYLQSHTIDIANTLIGGPIPQVMLKLFDPLNVAPESDESTQLRQMHANYANVIDLLFRWEMMSTCDAQDRIIKEVGLCTQNLRRGHYLCGDLAAFSKSDPTDPEADKFLIFGRLASPSDRVSFHSHVEVIIPLSLSLSHTHTHTLTHSHTLTHVLTHSLTLSPSLSLTLSSPLADLQ